MPVVTHHGATRLSLHIGQVHRRCSHFVMQAPWNPCLHRQQLFVPLGVSASKHTGQSAFLGHTRLGDAIASLCGEGTALLGDSAVV